MPRPDDFSPTTKEILAKRAGYRCSFLGCGAPTYGPSEETGTSTTAIGMACHISAASAGPGSRRYIGTLTPKERKHINNGIWMCYTHGKMIDADETRFSIEILQKWKDIATTVAQIMVEENCEYKKALKYLKFTDLAINNVLIDGVGSENEIIGNAMDDCCVSISWGKHLSYAVRDFIIEHIRNAFQHGKATEINFEARNNRLIITDNGKDFDPRKLLDSDNESGGTVSIKELISRFSSKLILSTQRDNNLNVTTIAKIKNADDILEITPCSYKINNQEFRQGNINILISESCKELFVVLPSPITLSDLRRLDNLLIYLTTEKRSLIFITTHLSELVVGKIKAQFPNSQVIETE